MTTKAPREQRTTSRNDELKVMLEHLRGELLHEVQGKIRDARADDARERDVLDEGERSEVGGQSELGFALLQMTAETLDKVDIALRRLQEGGYGNCVECLASISEARLRALPFAVRCTGCEDAREVGEHYERSMMLDRRSTPLFADRTY